MRFTRSAFIAVRFAVGAGPRVRHDEAAGARRRTRRGHWLPVGVAAVASVVAATGALGGTGSGTITTIAGILSSPSDREFSGDGGPATKARLSGPHKVAVDTRGNVYIADYLNDRVRKVTPAGRITTFAGGSGFGDPLVDGGPATGPSLLVQSLATDRAGNVYIGWEFGLVWRVGRDGKVTTIAGRADDKPSCGGPPFPPCGPDGGPATSALLYHPSGLALDARGNLYIGDRDDHRVRKVTPDGTITTIAGISRKFGFSGDGGPGTRALLNSPTGVAVDAKGNVYISDTLNNRVRKVTPAGKITTFAGTGKRGFSGDGGPAIRAKLSSPAGLAVDGKGNLYIADKGNARVREVTPGGTITTIAGTGGFDMSGDGPATKAQVVPDDIAVDSKGNVYIAESGSNRVRKVRP